MSVLDLDAACLFLCVPVLYRKRVISSTFSLFYKQQLFHLHVQ